MKSVWNDFIKIFLKKIRWHIYVFFLSFFASFENFLSYGDLGRGTVITGRQKAVGYMI